MRLPLHGPQSCSSLCLSLYNHIFTAFGTDTGSYHLALNLYASAFVQCLLMNPRSCSADYTRGAYFQTSAARRDGYQAAAPHTLIRFFWMNPNIRSGLGYAWNYRKTVRPADKTQETFYGDPDTSAYNACESAAQSAISYLCTRKRIKIKDVNGAALAKAERKAETTHI